MSLTSGVIAKLKVAGVTMAQAKVEMKAEAEAQPLCRSDVRHHRHAADHEPR